jgi:RNA polymerase sigma-70 factor (ECF subfamily)
VSETSERELVERCRSGDDDAFRELVDRHKRLVFALISRSVSNPARVEELSQEVFLRVHRGLPYFRGEARLSTWIFRIVQNVCVQARSGRPPDVSLDDGLGGDRPPRQFGSEDRAFDSLEDRDRLDKALARLPPNYRMLVVAHYIKGVQYEALAEALNLPLGTVKTHLYRAKRRLRELLEK